MRTLLRPRQRRSESGYSLIELLVSLGIFTAIMGATLAGLSSANRANQLVIGMASMNSGLRAGMDLMTRDLLQVGSGLPPSHVIEIPSGPGASAISLPGPPGTDFTLEEGRPDIPAVIPFPGGGPRIVPAGASEDGVVPTDVLIVLMADNAFLDVPLTAITATSIDVAAGPVLDVGPDRVTPGQLMMVTKGSATTLVQVTDVDVDARRLVFAEGDSLNLNQPGARFGTLAAVNAADPPNRPALTRVSRIRMITYYLDGTTDPARPRLVRRVNNGSPTVFDNDTLGTAVAMDVENLQFTFDIVDGETNPANVRMTAQDRDGTGRCNPNACEETQIRKVNIVLSGRTRNMDNGVVRNMLTSQVSFRGMAFVDEYKAPGS